jgi:hypothetical protein
MWNRPIGRRQFLATAAATGAGLALSPLDTVLAAKPPSGPPQATPSQPFNAMFTAYGNNVDPAVVRWTGGDSTYSIPLPDGRTVWIFSDTFLGFLVLDPATGTYTRPADQPLVNNTYVIQEAGQMTLSATLFGGTSASPEALIKPSVDDDTWYWMGDATIEGDRLRQVVVRWRKTGSGFLEIAQVGTDLATLSLPDLTLERIDPLPGAFIVSETSGFPINFGAAIREQDDATYIFGVEDSGFFKYLHLARAAVGDIGGAWTYRTADGRWSSDPQASARLTRPDGSQLENLSNEIGVSKTGPSYSLIDQDFQIGNDILLYRASRPGGPWTNVGSIYTCPESTQYHAPIVGPVIPYNSKQHPQFKTSGRTLVSYNVNTFNGPDHYLDASIYRPRFLTVVL